MALSSSPVLPSPSRCPRFMSRYFLGRCLLVSFVLLLLASTTPLVGAQTSSATSLSITASGSSASVSSALLSTNASLISTSTTSTESAYPTATYPSSWAGVATAPGPLSTGSLSATGPDDSYVVSAACRLALGKGSVVGAATTVLLYIGWTSLGA